MAEKAHDPIALMCRVLGVSRSGLYAWTRCPMPACHQPPLLRAQALASRVSRPLRGVAPQRAQALRELHGPRRPSTCHQELRDCQQVAPGRQPSPWSSAGPSRVAQLAWPGGAGPARAPAPSRLGPLAETQDANGDQQRPGQEHIWLHIDVGQPHGHSLGREDHPADEARTQSSHRDAISLPRRHETRPPSARSGPSWRCGGTRRRPAAAPNNTSCPRGTKRGPLRPLRPLLALRGHAPPPRGGAQQCILPPRTRNEAGCPKGCRPR
jgi:hypothetical protein